MLPGHHQMQQSADESALRAINHLIVGTRCEIKLLAYESRLHQNRATQTSFESLTDARPGIVPGERLQRFPFSGSGADQF